MMLRNKQKKASGGRPSQGQPAKIKTFSGSFDPSSVRRETPENGNSFEKPSVPEAPAEAETGFSVPEAPAADSSRNPVPDSAELQDTLWTEDKFNVLFLDDYGRLLHRCEVSYGEKPVYSGKPPVRPDDGDYSYSFAGWTPEIVPAVADAAYTALFSREPKSSSGMEYGSEPLTEETPEEYEYGRPDEGDSAPESVSDTDPFSWGSADSGDGDADVGAGEEEDSAPESVSDTDPFSWGSVYSGDGDADVGTEEEGGGEDFFTAGFRPEDEEDEKPAGIPDGEGLFVPESFSGAAEDLAPEGQLLPLLEAEGKTALRASWQVVGAAEGYDVFLAQCGTEYGDPCRTLSSGETSVTLTGLKKKTAYKMRVKAFVLSGERKTYIGKSCSVYSLTGGGSKKHTNAKEILPEQSVLDLSAGDRKKISAEVSGTDPEKEVYTRGNGLRYLSDDPEVASVSKDGRVRAVGTGTCRIWMIAANGLRAAVEVTVRDASGPVSFKKKKYTVNAGEKINLRKKLNGLRDQEEDVLKWKSSDDSIASVSKKGVVRAHKKGKVTVRVKTAEGARAKVQLQVRSGGNRDSLIWDSFSTGKGSGSSYRF